MFVDEKSVGEKQPAQMGYLRLSEAIRIGSKLRHQCTGEMFKHGGSCAIGAAYEAVFGHPGESANMFGASEQSALMERLWKVIPIPSDLNPIEDIGMDRNDNGWSRERIADWLESQGY